MESAQEVQLSDEVELVTFSVCDQIFCLRITEINEIRRVDSVSEIISIKSDEIQVTPDIGCEGTQNSIQGVIALEDNMVRVIDLQSVISDH